MTSPLHRELANHQYLLAEYKKRFPDEDESDLAEALEGETNLTEALARLLWSALWDLAQADAAARLMEDLAARRNRYVDRGHKKRALAQEVMERASVRKFEAPDMTVSLRKCPPNNTRLPNATQTRRLMRFVIGSLRATVSR